MTISFYIHSFMLSLFVYSSLCMLIPFVQAEEEVRELQKKMQQLENDLDQTQEKLMNANQRLEEKEKALQNVSIDDVSDRVCFLGQRRGGGFREKVAPARE